MRWSAVLVLPLFALSLSLGTGVQARPQRAASEADDPTIRASKARGLAVAVRQANCGGGSYSVVNSPDGTSVSVLFDDFTAQGSQAVAGAVRTTCAVRIPLNLPAGYSLGVFRMDYRGFAHLDPGQGAQLSVDYGVGRQGRGRNFRRGLKGAFDGDFSFAENIGAGLMKRAGCGEDAALNLSATLDLRPNGGSREALVTLDSIDGSAPGGVVFHIDLKKCRPDTQGLER